MTLPGNENKEASSAQVKTNVQGTQNDHRVMQNVQKMQRGEAPGNDDMKALLNEPLEVVKERETRQHDEKKKQVDCHVAELIHSTFSYLDNKNSDGLFQSFLEHAAAAGKEQSNDPTTKQAVEKGKQEAQKTSHEYSPQEAGQGLINLLKELISDREFRSSLQNISDSFSKLFIPDQETRNKMKGMKDKNLQDIKMKKDAEGNDTYEVKTQDRKKYQFKQDAQEMDKIADELIRAFRKASEKPRSRQASLTLWHMASRLNDTAQETGKPAKNTNLARAKEEFLQILEQVSGGVGIRPMILSFHHFREALSHDSELNKKAQNLQRNFMKLMKEQDGQKAGDHAEGVGKEIKETLPIFRNAVLGNKNTRKHIVDLVNDTRRFLKALNKDTDNKRIADAMGKLQKDLFVYDESTGTTKLSQKAAGELKDILIQVLRERMSEVPIPRIEGRSEEMDFDLDHIIIRQTEKHTLVPDNITIKSGGKVDADLSSENQGGDFKSKVGFTLKIHGLRMRADNVHFWFHKKTTPKLDDKGVIDVILGNRGINLDLEIEAAQKGGATKSDQGTMRLKNVNCTISGLKLKVIEAEKHKFLLTVASPFVSSYAKKQLQNGVEQQIKDIFENAKNTDTGISNYMSNIVNKYTTSTS